MPSLIEKHRKQVAASLAKQTFAILNNAIERAKADYGMDVSSWEWIEGTNKEKSIYFAEKYMLPYLKTIAYSGDKAMNKVINLKGYKGTYATNAANTGVSFVLNNGSLVYLDVGYHNEVELATGEDYNRVWIIYDIDGVKGYNQEGKDIFRVELGGLHAAQKKDMSAHNRFLPYHYDNSRKCEDYLSSSFVGSHGCKDGTRYACLAYIMCNGWQIDDKYPW